MGNNFLKDNWPHIFTVVIIFITLIVIFQTLGVNFNPKKDSEIQKVVTIEKFDNASETIPASHDNNLNKIHKTCKSLSTDACSNASYCVLLDGNKCVGGNKSGPTYLTENGESVDYDYYHHKKLCKGKCPDS